MTAPLDLADLGRRLERLDVAEAQRDQAVDLLVALLRQITRIGEYKTPEELQTLWQIHALLTELGVEYR